MLKGIELTNTREFRLFGYTKLYSFPREETRVSDEWQWLTPSDVNLTKCRNVHYHTQREEDNERDVHQHDRE